MAPGGAFGVSASTAATGGSITVDARMVSSSGIGTYLRNVLPRVIAGNPQLDFRLIGGEELFAHAWARGERVRRVESTAPLYSIREQIAALKLPGPADDLFWSPHYNIPLARRGRLLVTVHDLAHLALPEMVRGAHRRAYARMMFRGVRRATARIFDSRFSADEYARLVGPAGRLDAVVYPGVDESWFSVPDGASPHPRPYLLYVGNVKPHKNLRGLVEAFSRLSQEVPHDLVIVGRKSGFIHGDGAVDEAAARLGSRVSFTGWVDEARLQQYFVHADALAFPSLYEGFGLPPLEAMACGCPVVVAQAASLPEVCGDAALYCDPVSPRSIADQILRLLREPALRSELVARGRERARGFTWERCAEETSGVMRASLEEGREF